VLSSAIYKGLSIIRRIGISIINFLLLYDVSFIIKLIDKYKKNELNIKIKKVYVLKKVK
jgi:hypothetical protein